MKRRDFIKASALSGSAAFLPNSRTGTAYEISSMLPPPATSPAFSGPPLPDLTPARWLWYPSGRCLPNTIVLFRKELNLRTAPVKASGWISADSRYRLEVNGERIQWGPAPCDPRWLEADTIDLSDQLHPGGNVLGCAVLFYGLGDGTSPLGKPGFLFYLRIEYPDGSQETIVSDATWQAMVPRSWKPGHYKRWYLRSLQEEFDARRFPFGWSKPGYNPTADWLSAMELQCPSDKPPVCSNYPEYMLDMRGDPQSSQLRPRTIPQLLEENIPIRRLAESCWIHWKRSPEEYFECRPPESYTADRTASAIETSPGEWTCQLDERRGAALTFELAEQVVGWPYFTIHAPAGTVVEMLVHEAHQLGGSALINTHFDSWTRFICREGENHFESFDFECCRWIQLHIHDARGIVRITSVGMRRRKFPWPNQPEIRVSEPQLQRLMNSCVNTLHNCAQETLVDGMGRERQQYSGDCGHQTHAIYMTFGEYGLPARYLATFSQGMTLDGFFLDCWPAYDRLARLMERQLHLTSWGPILDHGIGFNFDCYYHYLYTGDTIALQEPYPRLLRFTAYLKSLVGSDGLLPVENLGVPSVWIDHNAYLKQRHKQCAFNLYTSAMLRNALAPICRAFKDTSQEEAALEFANDLQTAIVRKFWSLGKNLFINNLPWLSEEKEARLCDRSLATALLFDQCPAGRTQESLRALAECPGHMGFSYPANAGWRLWALARGGRTDVIAKDLRDRWATMESVLRNNTLQEDWKAQPDSSAQWSHCPVVPLYIAQMSLAGIRPLTPGFSRCEIRPQLADIESLELTARTIRGPIIFRAAGKKGARMLEVALPAACEGELVVPMEEKLPLKPASVRTLPGLQCYVLPGGTKTKLRLEYI